MRKYALHRLPQTSQETYEVMRTALQVQFHPKSQRTRYQVEVQIRRKKANEGWADFADDFKAHADKEYPTLQEEARDQLGIIAFLQQPQIAFSVKQKRQKSLDDAVAATLQMESYLAGPSPVGIAST